MQRGCGCGSRPAPVQHIERAARGRIYPNGFSMASMIGWQT